MEPLKMEPYHPNKAGRGKSALRQWAEVTALRIVNEGHASGLFIPAPIELVETYDLEKNKIRQSSKALVYLGVTTVGANDKLRVVVDAYNRLGICTK